MFRKSFVHNKHKKKINMGLGIHILITILLTQIVALLSNDSTLPYFPIEISRTVASSFWSKTVFTIGILSLSFYLSETLSLFPLWSGLCIVAIFDDFHYWYLHMFGALSLFPGALFHVLIKNGTIPQLKMATFACAVSIYVLRLVLKFIIIFVVELDISVFQMMDISYWELVISRAKYIMYNGSTNKVTLAVFRVAGVMQWLVFYLLYHCIE
jgi:hypothetical protein